MSSLKPSETLFRGLKIRDFEDLKLFPLNKTQDIERMKYMEKLLWWLITGKRGGINRARIIKKLNNRPYNTHQLAKELDLDYKTVRHHIKILEENKVIKSTGDSYSKLYFLTEDVEKNYDIFQEIWEKIIEK